MTYLMEYLPLYADDVIIYRVINSNDDILKLQEDLGVMTMLKSYNMGAYTN